MLAEQEIVNLFLLEEIVTPLCFSQIMAGLLLSNMWGEQ